MVEEAVGKGKGVATNENGLGVELGLKKLQVSIRRDQGGGACE
jgi:hypothetical protein